MRKIRIIEGDILRSHADLIVQQVNCAGVIGGGLAEQIIERYPNVKKEYLRFYNKQVPDKTNREQREKLLGVVQYVDTYDGTIIANVFGQVDIRENWQDRTVFTKKEALWHGIQQIHDFAAQQRLTIAIPTFIGCGLANGNWGEIKAGIDRIFAYSNVEVLYFNYRK